MIKVVLFASIREKVGTDAAEVASSDVHSVADVITRLRARGGVWNEALSGENILVAVNQTMTDPATRIADGDEVALFPPVTGG